jgi:ketosteroid isomerase-like protein
MKQIWFVVCMVVLAACTRVPSRSLQPVPAPTPTPTFSPNFVDPYIVIKGMYSALNNGDIAGAMNYFSDDAVYIVRVGSAKGIYNGKNEIQQLLQPESQNHILSVISDFEDGYNVLEMMHQRIQNAQAISSEIVLFSVIDGKITGVGVDPDSLIRYTFNALNENKVDRALSLFADDPVCLLIANAPLVGKQAIQEAVQAYVNAGDLFEVSNIDAVEYYKVTWTLKIYDPRGKVIAEVRRLSSVESGRIKDCKLPESQ